MNLDNFCKIYENNVAQKINILFNEGSHESLIDGVKKKSICMYKSSECELGE